MQRQLYLALLAFLVAAACKSDEQKVLAAHGDAMKAQLAKIAAIKPLVDAAPKLTADTWPVPGAKHASPLYAPPGEKPQGNMLVAWADQLATPCTTRNITYAKDNSGMDFIILVNIDHTDAWLRMPSCALAGDEQGMMGLDERMAKRLIDLQYILVLRTDEKDAPKLDSGEVNASIDAYMKTGKGTDVKHFASGHIAGDALLFEIATGKQVGGFHFDAKNSAEISVRGAGIDEMRDNLSSNLEAHIQDKLIK